MAAAELFTGHSRALCQYAEEDEKLCFMPDRENSRTVKVAKAICEKCPVETSCLEYALNTEQPGIWGGTTEDEREVLRKYYRRQIHSAMSPQ